MALGEHHLLRLETPALKSVGKQLTTRPCHYSDIAFHRSPSSGSYRHWISIATMAKRKATGDDKVPTKTKDVDMDDDSGSDDVRTRGQFA